METKILIERYLDSEMAESEKNALREILNADTSLTKELSLRKDINEFLTDSQAIEFRNKLALASLGIEKRGTWNSKRTFYAAATLAGIAIGGWATFNSLTPNVTALDLYKQNLKPYPTVQISRFALTQAQSLMLQQALQSYSASNFFEASQQFEQILLTDPQSVSVKFYLGISYLYLEQFDKSFTLLNEVSQSETLLSQQAYWYLGLGFLAQSNVQQAEYHFTKVELLGGKLAESASEMKRKLKKIH